MCSNGLGGGVIYWLRLLRLSLILPELILRLLLLLLLPPPPLFMQLPPLQFKKAVEAVLSDSRAVFHRPRGGTYTHSIIYTNTHTEQLSGFCWGSDPNKRTEERFLWRRVFNNNNNNKGRKKKQAVVRHSAGCSLY